MPAVPKSAIGPATSIHCKKETSMPTNCCSETSAIAFCGEAIGVIIPPRLQEKARPSSRAREKRESEGNSYAQHPEISQSQPGQLKGEDGGSCSSGCTTASRSTGAVTLEMPAERRRPGVMMR